MARTKKEPAQFRGYTAEALRDMSSQAYKNGNFRESVRYHAAYSRKSGKWREWEVTDKKNGVFRF